MLTRNFNRKGHLAGLTTRPARPYNPPTSLNTLRL